MIPLKSFPTAIDNTLQSVCDAVRKIGQVRQDDQRQWNDLQNQFISGRRVPKVPANSADTTGNSIGDFNVTATFAYFCVDNAGTVEWVRVAVGTF